MVALVATTRTRFPVGLPVLAALVSVHAKLLTVQRASGRLVLSVVLTLLAARLRCAVDTGTLKAVVVSGCGCTGQPLLML